MKSLAGLRGVLSMFFLTLFVLSACKKDHPPTQSARGSLVTEIGNCYPYTQHGNFYNGVKATDSDYIEIFVDVTNPGSYKVTTDQQKGVSFSASGVFNDTGLNTVRLRPTGVFTDHNFIANFTTSFDSSHCLFSVTIHDSAALSIADNTFEFTAAGKFYHGPVFGAALLLPGGDDPTNYYGSMQGFSDTSLTILIGYSVYDTANICLRSTSGMLNTGSNIFSFTTSPLSTDPPVHYRADRTTAAAGAVINFTTCSDVWTFNGAVLDANANVVPVTNGRLRCSNVRQDYLH